MLFSIYTERHLPDFVSRARKQTVVIEYRPFHNTDPPCLVDLWHDCRLGRGAAEGFTTDALEAFVFSQPFFDKQGLILARDGEQTVGFVHAGFAPNATGSGLDTSRGLICAVLVHPGYRRQGIGRELLRRAEEYLRSRGSQTIQAGPGFGEAPYYLGLYGGTEPAGFLLSDPDAQPFLLATGYKEKRRFGVFQRDISQTRDPVNMKLINARRKMQLAVADQMDEPTWWWTARFGRLDSAHFTLVPKKGGPAIGGLTIVDLELYIHKWQQRTIGLTDLGIIEAERRQGYGLMLLVEVCRRLREELVTHVEITAPEDCVAGLATFNSAGFSRIDTGITYERSQPSA